MKRSKASIRVDDLIDLRLLWSVVYEMRAQLLCGEWFLYSVQRSRPPTVGGESFGLCPSAAWHGIFGRDAAIIPSKFWFGSHKCRRVVSTTHPWPQHAGVHQCLSGWGMRGHCLLHLRVESVWSFGRMDEDGFAPYLRTRCPWRLAATVGQASGAPARLIPIVKRPLPVVWCWILVTW